MVLNPKLYEINTRVWIKQFGSNAKLSEIPRDLFVRLKQKGFDIIWIMGIWETCPDVIKDCCFSVELVSAYNKTLKDWKEEDVIGSPYSIDDYNINPLLGNANDLGVLKEKINSAGLKLFLDFIPNHFSTGSHLIDSVPELFLPGDEELLRRDSYTFFHPRKTSNGIFAHGRDPLFPPWTDTIQVNYFSETAREFMTNVLLKLSSICDGVRCDMAMLPLNNVFHNTWIGAVNRFQFKKPECEFWKSAIETVKMKNPEFLFLGEAYWDLEWHLQQLGFDFTYDKRLTDRLGYNDITGIKAHLSAEHNFQLKSVRFLENHDETRAVSRFGKLKSLAAAVIASTILGMKFYYDGQFEGKKIKLPLQLGREPEEKISKTVSSFYNRLLQITNNEVFRTGEWMPVDPAPASAGNTNFEHFLVWEWRLKSKRFLVAVNYSDATAQCRIRFNIKNNMQELILTDELTGETYKRNLQELNSIGLFVELKAYQSHIFSFTVE